VQFHRPIGFLRAALAAFFLLWLAGCAGPKYTVDDGRKVDETLLANIRAYGQGEQALRPAIQRTAALKDPECDKQWELPFAVATSYGWSEVDRVAWVRALRVDERLTVVAVAPRANLAPGDKIIQVGGYANDDSEKMLENLAELRERGKPFMVALVSGRQVQIQPFEVCRGYARLAPPSTPALQDYHWLLSMHPLEVMQAEPLSDDEALWAVLWGQGLSEEGGARMKTFHYSTKIAGTLYNLVTLATGLKGAALAADAAVQAAKSAAANVATEVIKQQLIEQGKALAAQRMREGLSDAVQSLSKQQVANAMQAAAANRGSLSGVARIGATVFDRADQWSFDRIAKIGGSQLAGFSLHQKLIEHGFTSNAFALDIERLDALNKLAKAKGMEAEVVATLRGVRPDQMLLEMGSMPLASAQAAFSFESPDDPGQQPFARGLIDAMLDMPAETGTKKK